MGIDTDCTRKIFLGDRTSWSELGEKQSLSTGVFGIVIPDADGQRCLRQGTAFWRDKLNANRRRDGEAIAELSRMGWRTLVIWECETRLGNGLLLQLLKRFLDEDAEIRGS